MAQAAAGFLSLRPSEFIAGGLIDDVDAVISDAKFTSWDYNGTQATATPALGVELTLEDGTKQEQYYSAGDAKYWAPSNDGKTLVPCGDKTHLTNSCKLALFLTELVNAGFPEDKLVAGDITCLVGLKAHFQRKADPKRGGLVRTGRNAEKEQSTLVVTKIIAMPGEAVAAPAKAAAAPAGKPAVAAPAPAAASAPASGVAAAADVEDAAVNVMLEVVPANGGSVTKNKLSQLAFKHITRDHAAYAVRTAVTQMVFSDSFLKKFADQGMWEFDGTTVKIA